MEPIHLPSGTRLSLPPELELTPTSQPSDHPSPTPLRRGGRRLPTSPQPLTRPASSEIDVLLQALADDDLTPLDDFQLRPPPTAGLRRSSSVTGPMKLEVDLDPDQSAAVLLEQDGLYSWHFPQPDPEPKTTTRSTARRSRTIEIQLAPGRDTTESPTRGPLTDLLWGGARAVLFRFGARLLAHQAGEKLEKNVQPGFVLPSSASPMDWPRLNSIADLPLPSTHSPRILLLIHGTFSSTRGGFGALAATPWGRDFLTTAQANYDAVIGFDHPTLSVSPEINAIDLLDRLRARPWPHPPRFDVLCHSRGSLTTRALLEHILPASGWAADFQRVIFVGGVNQGTRLAQPQHWGSFIDLITNLAAGTCRAMALFPQTTFAAELLRELVHGLGSFAKTLASEIIEHAALPGLAAMEPTGPFVQWLNQTQPGQPLPAACRWYAVTSEFTPRLALDSLRELPRRLLISLADGLIDRLMGEANDLVVHTASMAAIDAPGSGFIKDSLDFGANGVVFHTNYFLQPRTLSALALWLDLLPPDPLHPHRMRGILPAGASIGAPADARLDTHLLTLPATELASDAFELVQSLSPSFVIVERFHQGHGLRYAFRSEELLAAATRHPTQPLLHALDLHEFQASPHGPLNQLPLPDPTAPHPTAQRVIALSDLQPVGVLESIPATTPTTPQLVALAQTLLHPQTPADFIQRQRTLPMRSRGPLPSAPRNLPFIPASNVTSPPPTLPAPPAPAPFPPPLPPSPTPPRRGGLFSGSSPAPAPESLPPDASLPELTQEKDTCHFRAEMDAEVALDETATIDVTVAREAFTAPSRSPSAEATAPVALQHTLTLELIPRLNLRAVGRRRFDIPPPAPGQPFTACFDVQPTAAGPAEAWVRIRQDGVPLVTLELQCHVVSGTPPHPGRLVLPAAIVEPGRVPAPQHQLTIFERLDQGRVSYQFILDSSAFSWKHVFESPPLAGDRQAYIDRRYAEIEQRWLGNVEHRELFHDELRAIGAQIWDDLFPPDLQRLLWERRQDLHAILVFSEEPFIPWELVHFKEPGRALNAETRFFAQCGLVRWLHRRDALAHQGYPPSQLHARPGRCRFIIPDYPDPAHQLPEAHLERAFLQHHFQATPIDPQPGPVQTALRSPGTLDLLHFAGHGEAESQNIAGARLLLQGRVDARHTWIPASLPESAIRQFAQLAGPEGDRPLVFLNACQAGRAGYHLTGIGGFARAFLHAGAGAFVGSSWAVGDAPARTFGEHFYQALLSGQSLATAANAGREAARAGGDASWLAYTVYGHPDARLLH